jgi:hypothetical protein
MITITTAHSDAWQDLADITVPNMARYCKKQSYSFELGKILAACTYWKIQKIYELFELGSGIVFYLDLDALITNHNIRVESFLDEDHDFYITQDINEINAGTMIARNSKWSRSWLRRIMDRSAHFENEQNALKPFESHHKVKILEHPSINSYPYDEYAPTYGLIPGRTPLLGIEGKPTHEQGDWKPGDFIMHLPGLPRSRKIEIFNRMKAQIIL